MNRDAIEERVIVGSIEELWKIIRALKTESNTLEEAYQTAKRGINIPFDINHYIKGHYIEKFRTKTVEIAGLSVWKEPFWKEIDTREDHIRYALLNHLKKKSTIKPRGEIA